MAALKINTLKIACPAIITPLRATTDALVI